MSYIVKKRLKNRDYFYVVSNIKLKGKTKKFQVYIGTKKPEVRKLPKYSKILQKRIENFLLKTDPLLSIVSKSDLRDMEKVKKWYKSLSRQSPAIKQNYYEWFITTFTYDSNAIEGSTLSLRETAMALFEGISPAGKPLRDVIAAENHKKAFDWIVLYKGNINKQFILKLHRILTNNILNPSDSGKIRKVQVYVRGTKEIPPKPQEVELQLKALLNWYKSNKKRYSPVIIASYFHTAFEGIHPFIDFNGRTGRLLLNFILIKNGYPPIDIRNKDRQRYYSAIRSAITGDLKLFVNLVIKYLKGLIKTQYIS